MQASEIPPSTLSYENIQSAAFFGCSGAMVATFNEMNEPKVIGICRLPPFLSHSFLLLTQISVYGGKDQPMNALSAFTESGLEWIKKAVEDSDKLDRA